MAIQEMNDPRKIPESPKILEIIAHNLRTYLQSSQPKDFRIRKIEVNYNPEMQLTVVVSYGSAIMATGHGPTLDVAVSSAYEQALYEERRRDEIRPAPRAQTPAEIVKAKLGISLDDLFR